MISGSRSAIFLVARLDRRGDPRMQRLARPAQQRAIGGVLDQRVLELVLGGGRRAALEHKAGGDELVERAARLGFAARRDGGDQLVGKFAADRGAGLRDFARCGSEPVEPRHQRGLQGRGDGGSRAGIMRRQPPRSRRRTPLRARP